MKVFAARPRSNRRRRDRRIAGYMIGMYLACNLLQAGILRTLWRVHYWPDGYRARSLGGRLVSK